jgi:hypothetical protein
MTITGAEEVTVEVAGTVVETTTTVVAGVVVVVMVATKWK